MLTSDSVQLYLKIAGKGIPCIFVHGGPGAWSFSFEAMGGNALEKNLAMYYFDQRGCGRSGSPANKDYSVERMVNDIEEIRMLSGVDKVYVMGHSFGGILAHSYALRYPQHVKGLVLLNSTLSINNSLINQIQFINKLLGENVMVTNRDSIMTPFMEAKSLLSKRHLDYKMLSDNKAAVDRLDSIDNCMPRNYTFAQNALSSPVYFRDFTTETQQVKMPVLVISGTKDNNIGPDHYKLFRYPNQKVVKISGGHILYYEKNREFVQAVTNWINR
ncbi:alpha/beta hydrolase [Flavihumibacter solisilvae]|uniref:Alpha/beta hydrolase n=1 Tax=Flavihumibacter solisilvae TaxID=1349421 RepID=A0A0C1L7L8_9BACT|nr:alpha/beta hydrolase [Flavihumibacter solisilvae]